MNYNGISQGLLYFGAAMGQAEHYFSRRGETLDQWVDAARQGAILIFPHLAENHDTVKTLAKDRIKKEQEFDRIEELVFEVPAEITADTSINLVRDLKKAFEEPTSNEQRTLRIAVFLIETDEKGKFPPGVDTFCHILSDLSENDGTKIYADPKKGNTIIFPIVDIKSCNVLDRPAETIYRKLRGRPQQGKPAKRVKFDIRTFDKEHLWELLQPEFPDEDLLKNPDFEELAETYKGESRLAFAVRNYRRKKTLEHFRNAKGGPLTGNDFSTVFGFVKSLMLDMDVVVVPKSGKGPAGR